MTNHRDDSYYPIKVRYDCDNKDTIVERPEDLRHDGFIVIETRVNVSELLKKKE